MPDNGTVTTTSLLNAVDLIPEIYGESGPAWSAPTVNIRSGNAPS